MSRQVNPPESQSSARKNINYDAFMLADRAGPFRESTPGSGWAPVGANEQGARDCRLAGTQVLCTQEIIRAGVDPSSCYSFGSRSYCVACQRGNRRTKTPILYQTARRPARPKPRASSPAGRIFTAPTGGVRQLLRRRRRGAGFRRRWIRHHFQIRTGRMVVRL